MSEIPQSNEELCQRIKQEFYSTYPNKCSKLSTKLRSYFIYHQFDDWQDIKDDINNGYDDCCCKQCLFEQLNITNIKQKHNEYQRLKRCIEPVNNISKFDTIRNDMIESFTKAFKNAQIAQNIWQLFNKVLENEEFVDQESVIDDTGDIEDSVIIAYVIKEINDNQFDQTSMSLNTINDIISNGIKCIAQDRKEYFLTEYLSSQSITQKHTTSFETSDMSIEGIAKQIGKEMGNKIKQLFIHTVHEDEFDVDNIQDDLDNVDDSIILQYIIDNIGNNANISENEIKTKIQKIVLPSNGLEVDFEEKKGMHEHSPPPQPITLLQKVRRRIEAMLHWEYFDFKNQVLIAYDNSLAKLKYNFEQLLDDVGDPDTSKVLTEISDINIAISENVQAKRRNIGEIMRKIKKIIETAKIQRPYFNITLFNFNVTKKDVEHTAAFVTEYCNLIYHHVMGVAKGITDSYLLHGPKTKQYEKTSTIESRSLCIAKSIDFKNLKSIMNWLLQLYSKERTQKYLHGVIKSSQGFSSNDWFGENEYAKWIMRTHPIIGENIRAGLAELAKRALVAMNFHYILFPIICDRLNDFAEYALAFHRVALHLKRKMEVGEFNAAPLQIDYWIIPEMTRSQGGSATRTPFDQSELKQKAQQDSNIDVDDINYSSDVEFFSLCQEGDGNSGCWDIEKILKQKCYGYISDGPNADYFIMDQAAVERQDTLNRGLIHMIKKYHQWNSTKQRRNRYVFIIDRRNRMNVKNQNINIKPDLTKPLGNEHVKIYMIAPKQYRTEGRSNEKTIELCICGTTMTKMKRAQLPKHIYDTTNHNKRNDKCHWCNKYDTNDVFICPKHKIVDHDEGYVLCSIECQRARPNTHCKLTKEWERVPEQCLSLSKNFILVNPNKDKKAHIRMDDACMGYMFGLSYHILREDNISTYFYHHGGGTAFNLSDIEHGWSKWFDKIKGKEQILDDRIKMHIKEINEKDELKLPNLGFQEFENQCRNKSNF